MEIIISTVILIEEALKTTLEYMIIDICNEEKTKLYFSFGRP